jgi:hypothetical protein
METFQVRVLGSELGVTVRERMKSEDIRERLETCCSQRK